MGHTLWFITKVLLGLECSNTSRSKVGQWEKGSEETHHCFALTTATWEAITVSSDNVIFPQTQTAGIDIIGDGEASSTGKKTHQNLEHLQLQSLCTHPYHCLPHPILS